VLNISARWGINSKYRW